MDFSVFDPVPIGLCVLRRDRKDLTCLYANTALKTMLGPDLEGRTLENFWPGGESADLARKLKGPTPPHEATLPYIRDGQAHWALLTISEDRYNGENTYALWAMDVSASKQAEENLKA